MSTEYDGEPLDHRWKSYIGSDNGETVEASNNGEQQNNTSTMYWPEGLPESVFEHDASGMQKEIIEKAAKSNVESNEHIADIVGCSEQHVQSVKSKVSLFVEPDSVSLEIPETPIKTGLTEPLLDHEQCRFQADTWAELTGESEKPDNDNNEKSVDSKEIGERHYEDGEDLENIAEDLGISVNAVYGHLAQYKARTTEDEKEQSINDEFQKFDALEGVFPDHYIEIFNRLAAGQNSSYIAEQIGMTEPVVYTVKHKSACYVDPEELPFEVPDGITEDYLNQDDKEALANRRQSGESVEQGEGQAGEPDSWPTDTEPRTIQTNNAGGSKSEQAELPADDGQTAKESSGVESSGRERVQTRVDADTVSEMRQFKQERDITESEAIRRLMRKGLTAESVEDCVNEDLEARVHELEKAIKQRDRRIKELVERVEDELTARQRRERRERKKAEAGLVTRTKWWLVGMDLSKEKE